jgi:hypothetical protein
MIFVGGLLGSSHCIGMCGAFAISLGATTPNWRVNLLRQVIYSAGRVFTYSSAGAMAGYGGWRLTYVLPPVVDVQSWLAVLAGVLLVIQGLIACGLWWKLLPRGGARPCVTVGLFASLLPGRSDPARGLSSVFVAGTLNGLLPCGLVYAYLALASSTGNMLAGFVHMALFGLGTLPIMVLTGCGGSLLSLASRRRLLHLAAFCVIATGAISIWRGAAFLCNNAQIASTRCPACAANEFGVK